MNWLVMAAILFFGAFAQAAIPCSQLLGNSACPVLLSVSVYYGLARKRGEALRAAFLAGMLQDALSQIPLGFSSLCFCAVAWTVHRFRDEVFIRNWITHVLFGAAANFGVVLVLGGMLWWTDLVRISGTVFLLKVLGSLLLGGLTAPIVYQLAEHLYRVLGLAYQDQKT